MTETKATRQLCKQLENLGCLIWVAVGSMRQEPGWPDRFIAHKQWSGWVEFKGPKTPWSAKQQWVARELRLRNSSYCLARFSEDFSRICLDGRVTCRAIGNDFLRALI